jgi:hypothetical protein
LAEQYRGLATYSATATTSDNVGRCLGVEFYVTRPCWLTQIHYFRTSTSVSLPQSGSIFAVNSSTSGTEISGSVVSFAGASGTGWLTATLATPIKLTPGQRYRAAVLIPGTVVVPGWSNYWSTGGGAGGHTSGPLVLPSAANATGGKQGQANTGTTTRGFPAGGSSSANYGIDVTVLEDDLVWKAATDPPSTVTTNVAAGYADNSSQRQNGAGQFNDTSTPWPLPVTAAPGGRPGRAVKVAVPANYRRVEMTFTAPHPSYFAAGDGPWWFGNAVYLEQWSIADPAFQTIEQIKQASTDGSPPIAFEVSDGALIVGGGWGIDTANPARLQWRQRLLEGVQLGQWIAYAYRLDRFSAAEGGTRLTVVVNGVELLTDFVVPPPTIIGGDSYRKQGLYHSASLPAATIWHAGAALGSTYESVDPVRVQTHQVSAGVVSGTRAGAQAGVGARAAAAAVSGARVDAAASVGGSVAAQLVSGTRAGADPVRGTPAAAELVLGTVVAAAPVMVGVVSAEPLVSGTVVGGDATQDTVLATGTRVDAAPHLEALAAATLDSGTVAVPDAVRATAAVAAFVSATRVGGDTSAGFGTAAAMVSGLEVRAAVAREQTAGADVVSGTVVVGDATQATFMVSATVVDAATELHGGIDAALVTATTVGGQIGHLWQGEAGPMVSATVVDVAVLREQPAAAALLSGTVTSAVHAALTRAAAARMVSGTVVDADLWNTASERVTIVSGTVLTANATAITPVFTAPPGPAVPQTPLPRLRLLVVDTVTGQLHFELPHTTLTWNAPLNGIGQCSAGLPISDSLDAVADQGAPDPRSTLREVLLGPYRWSLVVAEGNEALWGGPYIPSQDSPGGTIAIGAAGLERLLERRLLVNTDPRLTSKLSAADRDITFAQTTPAGAIYRIVLAAIDTHGGKTPSRALPIVCSRPPVLLGDETFTYLAYDVVSAWKAITDITGRDDGPDVRLEPRLVDADDGTRVVWDLQIGDPFLPASGNFGPHGPMPWTFDDADLARTVDATGLATAWWSTGDGQDREKKIVRAATDNLTSRGFPALEHVDTTATSETDLTKLEAANRAELAANQAPAATWKLTLPHDAEVPRRGDLARVDVTRQLLIEPGYYMRRVTDVAGDASTGRAVVSCDEMEIPLVETDPIAPSTGIPEPYTPPYQAPPAAVKVDDLTGPGYTDGFGVGGTDLGVPIATSDGRMLLVFGDTFEQATVGGPGWRSPLGLFYTPEGAAGAAAPRNPVWEAALGAGSTAVTNVQAGYADNPSQRQNGAGAFNDTSTPWPLPVVAAPGGRPGRAVKVAVPNNYRRVEMTFPASHGTFGNGAGPWYFGAAVYLEQWSLDSEEFQTVEQIKQASTQGSPPLSFEVRGGKLHVGGGWGIDGVNQTRLLWDRVLLDDVALGQWINLVYRIDRFSTAEGGSKLDVWVDGVQVVDQFTIPPPTVIPDPTGANGTNTYRKQGIYHSSSLPAATLYHAGAALGRAYADVDPTPGGGTPALGPLRPDAPVAGYGGSASYAGQLVNYTHNSQIRSPVTGVTHTISTQLPTDVIAIGSTMFMHVMASIGLGNVPWTEIHRSTDQGRTWASTGVAWPGDHLGGHFMIPTWERGGDGFVYCLSGGWRDRGLILQRVPEGSLLDKSAWRVWNGSAWVTSGAAVVLPGSFGEMCLRRIAGRWVLTGFDAGNYRIDARVFDTITNVGAAPAKTLITGTSWDREDHSRGQVAQLYGGYIVPGSRFDALHLVVSQWNTSSNWPYKAMQFRSDITDLTDTVATL